MCSLFVYLVTSNLERLVTDPILFCNNHITIHCMRCIAITADSEVPQCIVAKEFLGRKPVLRNNNSTAG